MIFTDLRPLTEGEPYVPEYDGEFVITDNNSYADVLRFMMKDLDAEEIVLLTRMVADEVVND
jgi:hypothetical protein